LFLLCGLGNKGGNYANTRHNTGYLVVDRFSEKYRIPIKKKVGGCRVGVGDDIILAKPDTFMNLSGKPVAALIRQMKLSLEDILIVHDDLDMDVGKVKIKWNGRDGGHKGVRSVADSVQSALFYRMKIGIGRNPGIASEDYVLSRFDGEDIEIIRDAVDRAAEAAHCFFFEGKEKAMSIYNKWNSGL
jgi:peptidyl-tRNA hydrolase, PTH1 family